jgi:hypothetical protein
LQQRTQLLLITGFDEFFNLFKQDFSIFSHLVFQSVF